MDRNELPARIKAPLGEALGDRLGGIILYGPEARDGAAPDRDVYEAQEFPLYLNAKRE